MTSMVPWLDSGRRLMSLHEVQGALSYSTVFCFPNIMRRQMPMTGPNCIRNHSCKGVRKGFPTSGIGGEGGQRGAGPNAPSVLPPKAKSHCRAIPDVGLKPYTLARARGSGPSSPRRGPFPCRNIGGTCTAEEVARWMCLEAVPGSVFMSPW